MPPEIRVGTIGWNYPEWKGLVYPADAAPEGSLLRYAEKFRLAEVSASYYKFPAREAIEEWNSQSPDGFTLSLKVPDWITKKPSDAEVPGKLEAFAKRVDPIAQAGKLGMLVAQFPPFFRGEKHLEELRTFVGWLPKGPSWGVELRHPSWWNEATYSLLRDAGVTLVWSVVESGRTPPVMTTDKLYLRLFGDHTLDMPYSSKRRDMTEEMSYWAARIRDEGASAKRVDVLLSNHLEGYGPGSAATMCGLLGLPTPEIGDLAGHKVARQTQLF